MELDGGGCMAPITRGEAGQETGGRAGQETGGSNLVGGTGQVAVVTSGEAGQETGGCLPAVSALTGRIPLLTVVTVERLGWSDTRRERKEGLVLVRPKVGATFPPPAVTT
jgi:hypothetical protein